MSVSQSATISATSASRRRSEWSPSTKTRVTGPGMAAVSAFDLVGGAKGVPTPADEETGHVEGGEVSGPEPFGRRRRMKRVADEDQGGHLQALRSRHRAHPAAHGSTAHCDGGGGHAEPLSEPRGGRPYRPDAHLRRIGPTPAGRPSGELDPFHGQTAPGHRLADGHQCRLVTARTGPRGQQQAGDARRGHPAILAPGVGRRQCPLAVPKGPVTARSGTADAETCAASRLGRLRSAWPSRGSGVSGGVHDDAGQPNGPAGGA